MICLKTVNNWLNFSIVVHSLRNVPTWAEERKNTLILRSEMKSTSELFGVPWGGFEAAEMGKIQLIRSNSIFYVKSILFIMLGKCMSMLNVSAIDTRDSKGRGRFFPFTPQQHLSHENVTKDHWYWQANYYSEKEVYSFLFHNIIFLEQTVFSYAHFYRD